MGSETPPVVSLSSQKNALLCRVVDVFTSTYNVPPQFITCVPGRVNLIGEHIDYCGYSVLPMALQQHILIAAKPTGDRSLKLVNVCSTYKSFEGSVNNLEVDTSGGVHWYKYILCGIRGASLALPEQKVPHGMQLAIGGNILPNAGLSSSSALVCASALTTAHLCKVKISKQELANLCAQCERFIGTEGGGMDQAIAFLANAGCAKHISFRPLSAADVKLPQGVAIVVAHSLTEVNKAASDHFNCRVAECRLAAQVLAHECGLPDWSSVQGLADVQTKLNVTLPQMVVRVKEILTKDSYSKNDVGELLGLSCEELEEKFLPENTWHINSFKLCQRAIHVFQEASRVLSFKEQCASEGNPSELGNLMNLSHDSLRDLYECSHPQLDILVTLARECGALGARLTGAGWGGCMVALTTKEHADTLMSSLKEKFYSSHPVAKSLSEDSYIFSTEPSCGAVIFE